MKKLLFLLLTLTIVLCLASCDWFETKPDDDHEHTWEYIQYETGHFKQFTCGCPSPTIMVSHCDSDDNGICDECEYGMCSTPENHKRIVNWNSEEHWWVYNCECNLPKEKEAHYDNDGNARCDVCNDYMPEPILLSKKESWLNEISSENVEQIKTVHGGYGHLFLINQTAIVTDKNDIAKIIEAYQDLIITPLDPMVNYDITAEQFEIYFILSNGETKKIYVGGGFMYYGRYSMMAPEIDKYESAVITYNFNISTLDQRVNLADGTLLGFVYNLEELTFIETDWSTEDTFEYYIDLYSQKFNWGKIYIYEDKYFYYEKQWYQFVDSDLYNDFDTCVNLSSKYKESYNEVTEIIIACYYGTYESGAIVGLIADDKTNCTVKWSENVAGYEFDYRDSARILVFYEGEFYTLENAYLNHYITEENLLDILSLHKVYLKYWEW